MARCREILKRALDLVAKLDNVVNYNTFQGALTKSLVEEVSDLANLLQTRYRRYSELLKESVSGLSKTPIRGQINAYAYGRLTRTLECLDVVLPQKTPREIFISHSSKDKTIVDAFVDKILRLGIGISPEEIFCTSLEDLRIRNGEDIRRHVHENILGCEYAFLLISDNYFKSAICQNELGAVWVSDAKVKIYTFPNVEIPKAIGWLCEPQVAESLSDEHALDRLFEEMKNDFSLSTSLTIFSKQRAAFLALLDKKKNPFSLDNFSN